MINRILFGYLGGSCYALFTWLVAYLDIIHWIRRRELAEQIVMTDFAAPFSLIAVFVFLTLYVYYKLQPKQRANRSFLSLWLIGLMFSVGATISLIGLSYLDATLSPILLASFFFVCLFIATLSCCFYLFVKPRKGNPTKEKLDEVFSNF